LSKLFRIIGPGRAGRAFSQALEDAGWTSRGFLRRGDDVAGAAGGVDLLAIATPDAAIEPVASAVTPSDDAVVVHLAGSLGTAALAPHPRRAAIHPLVSFAPATGSHRRDLKGAWFAVSGDPLAWQVVSDLEGRPIPVADDARTSYHAAAVIASNHLVALLGQVERVAARAGVPFEAYLDLVQGTVDNVAALGPEAALTGPVARGDWDTVGRHLAALPADERAAYRALADQAARLVPCR
jgi:predicted short-subunit dehydrogenase-like oxidoreductase (DUF2520 family)